MHNELRNRGPRSQTPPYPVSPSAQSTQTPTPTNPSPSPPTPNTTPPTPQPSNPQLSPLSPLPPPNNQTPHPPLLYLRYTNKCHPNGKKRRRCSRGRLSPWIGRSRGWGIVGGRGTRGWGGWFCSQKPRQYLHSLLHLMSPTAYETWKSRKTHTFLCFCHESSYLKIGIGNSRISVIICDCILIVISGRKQQFCCLFQESEILGLPLYTGHVLWKPPYRHSNHRLTSRWGRVKRTRAIKMRIFVGQSHMK